MQSDRDESVLSVGNIHKICQTLSGLLEKGFGPNALNTMMCSSTGTVMITSSGLPLLTALRLAHPAGRMVVDSVSKHHAWAGDHSKTFVLLLAEILRNAEGRLHVSQNQIMEMQTVERSKLIRGFTTLKQQIYPDVIVPSLVRSSTVVCLTDDNADATKEHCKNLVSTFMAGRLSHISSLHLSHLVVSLLFNTMNSVKHLIETVDRCIQDSEMLCLEISGQPVTSSKLLDGVIIQRDFLHLDRTLLSSGNVRFVLLSFVIKGNTEAPAYQPVFHAKSNAALSAAIDWTHKHVEQFLKVLAQSGVNLLLSGEKLDDLTVFFCKKFGISCAQMIPEEEIERLSLISRINVMHSVTDAGEKDMIGKADNCVPFNAGGRRYIHIDRIKTSGPENGYRRIEKQLLLCAPSPGVVYQVKCLVVNALKSVRAWLDTAQILHHDHQMVPSHCRAPGEHSHAIHSPGGAAIELHIHHCLRDHTRNSQQDPELKQTLELFADSLLATPLRLLGNSYASNNKRLTPACLLQLYSQAHAQGRIVGVDAKRGQGLLANPKIIEPLSSKITLFYELFDLISQLLKMDRVVAVSKPIKLNRENNQEEDI